MTSSTLIIKKIPDLASIEETKKFIEENSEQKVIEVRILNSLKFKNTCFCDFADKSSASLALSKLVKVDINGAFLKVEFAKERADKQHYIAKDDCAKNIEDDLFAYPFSGGLRYRYPKITPQIAENIKAQLSNNKKFYINVCHLMNLMNLDPPFLKLNEEDIFQHSETCSESNKKRKHNARKDALLCTDESELESSSSR